MLSTAVHTQRVPLSLSGWLLTKRTILTKQKQKLGDEGRARLLGCASDPSTLAVAASHPAREERSTVVPALPTRAPPFLNSVTALAWTYPIPSSASD